MKNRIIKNLIVCMVVTLVANIMCKKAGSYFRRTILLLQPPIQQRQDIKVYWQKYMAAWQLPVIRPCGCFGYPGA